mgnify:CR=1 FL=1
MFQLDIPSSELYDERTNEFVEIKPTTILMEHSLISLSKWESKWCTPFLSRPGGKERTLDQTLDYFRCMTINDKNVDPIIFKTLTVKQVNKIEEYINAPMTATTITDRNKGGGSRETLTSEVIYYMMIEQSIPFECEKWHLNRLLMLLRVCSAKNGPQSKMSKQETAAMYRELNNQRRSVKR